eukprot:9468-Heterococcus_DN1.PRE.1
MCIYTGCTALFQQRGSLKTPAYQHPIITRDIKQHCSTMHSECALQDVVNSVCKTLQKAVLVQQHEHSSSCKHEEQAALL